VIEPGGMARAVRAALESLTGSPGGALGVRFHAPLLTALVVDAADQDELVPAVAEVSGALERVGLPRGRQFALLGREAANVVIETGELVRRLRRDLGLAAFVHEPDGAAFKVGVAADGTAIELDDELREAEAVICVGRGFAADGRVHGGPYLLVPGVASERTRRALAAARTGGGERAALAWALAAEAVAPVDLAVCWDESGRVTAARGSERFAALAREAGFS